MSSNGAPSANLATALEMDQNTNSQQGPATGLTAGNTNATASQGISQGDHHGDGEKAMEMQRLHAAIQEEGRAQIEEAKRQEAEDKAEKAKKEKDQKARIQRAIQATPEERAAYDKAMDDLEENRRRKRHQAAIYDRINPYLEAMGRKPRR